MRGTKQTRIVKPILCVRKKKINGASAICMGMSGSGAAIGMTKTSTAELDIPTLKDHLKAPNGCFAADAGISKQIPAGLLTGINHCQRIVITAEGFAAHHQ